MSLTKPHPIWTSCGQNTFEVQKAVTASRMLSGRYLTDLLQSHWTQNKAGTCLLPTCSPVYRLSYKVSLESDHLYYIITFILQSENRQLLMQLIIDCTVIPEVIQITQVFGTKTRDRLLYLGRTWCYNIHRERMNQLGLINFR